MPFEEREKVLARLDKMQIPYELNDDGNAVTVVIDSDIKNQEIKIS